MSLCDSCKHVHRFEQVSGATTYICTVERTHTVPGDITKCSVYVHHNQPNLYELEKIAYTITIKKGGRIGLEPPAKADS